MLIDGIHIPLTVPITRDGAVYLRKLDYNVGRYSLTPAAGLVALTAASEAATLSDDEVREILHVIAAAAAPEKVLVAAVARDSVRGTLAVAEQAADAGFDAIALTAPPQWAALAHQELLLFFRAVADASPLPVMLSSVFNAQGYALPISLIAEMSRNQNVIGLYDEGLTPDRYRTILDATREVKREMTVTTVFASVTRRMQAVGQPGESSFVTAEALSGGSAMATSSPAPALRTRSKSVGFQVMAAGSARGFVDLLEAGVAGAMLTLSACAPQGCYEAYAAFKDGNPALAAEKGHRLVEADAAIRHLGIAGAKYGCDWNGYFGGSPRLPRLPLDAEGRLLVEQVLAGIRN